MRITVIKARTLYSFNFCKLQRFTDTMMFFDRFEDGLSILFQKATASDS